MKRRRIKLTAIIAIELIDARGTFEPQGPSLVFELAIQRILANTTNTTSHSVIYPAALDQNVTSGSAYLAHLIQSGVQRCPDQKYLLLGYSQGATLVLRALEQLSAQATEAVTSVILVGNPFRVPGRRSNTNREGQYDHRTAHGRFAAARSNGSIPMLSDTLDRSGRAKDVCLDVSTNEAIEDYS